MAWADVLEFQGADLGPKADSSTLIKLADLYHGPFLEGFDLPGCGEYEHWCILERVALENQYLIILGRLVEYCSSRGETGKAIYWAQRYLKTDPLSEAMHGQLIQLFAATGDRHPALKQYESCRTILESELGVSPLPETKAIYQAVLQSWHRFPTNPVSTPRPRFPVPDIPILGRETELKLLEGAFDNLKAHHSQVLLISGEAGIGKSHLMQHFAESKLNNAKMLHGAAYARERSISLSHPGDRPE
jgi:hypothetical protein